MNYKKLIIDSGMRMLNSGYTIETWGNISCRDVESNLVYLTPSGMDYTTITEEDVVVCDLQGNIIESTRKPTIETTLHLAIYRARPEVNAIVHTHPIYSTVFSCMGKDIPIIIDEAAQTLGDVCRTADYALPGTPELAENCVKALGTTANSCLLRAHGAVCIGDSMNSAFKVARVLEVTAQIYQMVLATDNECPEISKDNILAMQNFVKNMYGQR